MGESKRREKFTTVLDVMTGEPRQVRNAGDVSTFRRKFRVDAPNDVPCDGCSECCWHAGVDLDLREDAARLPHLRTERRDDGKLYLVKREDGACVHLGPQGCTVREHRPKACRNYDCRVYALVSMGDTFDGGRHSPGWFFSARTMQDRAFLEAARMCGVAELAKRRHAGDKATAAQVVGAVLDSPFFAETQRMFVHMWSLPAAQRDAFVRSLGLDPDDVEGLQAGAIEAMRKMVGDTPTA